MFLGCMLAGLQASARSKERVSLLEELRHVLKILEGELEYAHASLPEAFLKAGESRDPYGLFFSGMAEEMGTYPGKGRSEIFREQTAAVFSGTALKKEDVRILEELGERLGAADVHSQLQMLQLAEERAEFQKEKAQEEYRQKGKMARYLGICMGLFFVVLFF